MKLKYLFLSTIVTFLGGAAYAGYIQPASVDVNLFSQTASGDLLTARMDANENVFIGCGVRYIDFGGGTFAWGFCQAEDSEGDHIVCQTEAPSLLETIRGLSDYSFVTFSWVDNPNVPGAFECIRVGASTQSFYLPKEKDK